MWAWLCWAFRRRCHWCGSKEPGEWAYGMTRPGFVGWRRFCGACVERQKRIALPGGRSGVIMPGTSAAQKGGAG